MSKKYKLHQCKLESKIGHLVMTQTNWIPDSFKLGSKIKIDNQKEIWTIVETYGTITFEEALMLESQHKHHTKNTGDRLKRPQPGVDYE